jgi:hypothetical protein
MFFQDNLKPTDEPRAEYGFTIPASPEVVIENVYVSPTAPLWLKTVVQSLMDRFGLRRVAQRSSLADDPIF